MGSSQKPNRKDRPIINTPGLKGKEGGGGQTKMDLNNLCPLFLAVKLLKDPLLRKGQVLTLDGKGGVLANSRKVGSLTASQFRQITACRGEGYGYRGSVLQDKEKNLYGQLERYT